MIDHQKSILDEAFYWLGTPYHHQGRVKGVGVDCGTLICEVYEKVGLMDHLDPRPYPPDWHMHQMGKLYPGHIIITKLDYVKLVNIK